MDKLYNNPWFVKIISFFIALMLFAMVNYDNVNNQPGTLPSITSGSGTYTLEEIPLSVYYNEDEYAITEMVEHVQVNLRGPQTFLNLLKLERPSYEVFIDLRNLEAGTHYVNVQHRNFANEVTVNIVPQTVKVTMEEKRTISLPVEIDLINRAEVQEGYSIGVPIVNPVNIEITAAESIIKQVAFAKGFVDIKDVKQTIEKSIPVKVYDQQGNELSLDVNPPVVDVKIPVTSPNKDVPLKVKRLGELPEGLSVRSIVTDPKDVTIFGPNEIINEISFIDGIEIDLTSITESTILEVEIPVPEGVEKVSPTVVNVIIEVDLEEVVEIEDISIEVIGLSERMDATFKVPEEGRVSLTAKGSPTTMERFRKEDIRAYIDLNQLSVGEHEVPLQVNGPQNVTFKNTLSNVTVIISEVLSSGDENSGDVSESNDPNEETT